MAGQDFFAAEVAAVSKRSELSRANRSTRFLGHCGELVAVVADVCHLMLDDEMVLCIDGRLHVVANDTATARHYGSRVRIGQGDLRFARIYKLRFDFFERGHLQFKRCNFFFQSHSFRFCSGRFLPVGAIEFSELPADVRFDLLHFSLEFGVGKIPIAAVHSFEFASINGHNSIRKQVKLLAQSDELTAHIADRFAVFFSEVCDRLEVWFQAPRQPHQLDVSLGFALKASTRLDTVEIAINVKLEKDR